MNENMNDNQDRNKRGKPNLPVIIAILMVMIIMMFGGSRIFMKPATPGTGVKADGAMRAVLESVGIKDVICKSKGSSNPHNLVKATLKALSEMRSPLDIARYRGISVNKVFNG